MTQTIGYHTSDLEDADTLAEIAQTYGDRLEALDKGDKFGLLRQISDELNDRHEFESAIPYHPIPTEQLTSLSNDSLLGLMTATIEQLRHIR